MDARKRSFLLQGLTGASLLGLRSLATGLPISLLANPRRALADGNVPACTGNDKAQYLILSTSGAGDPVNCNVPGTYDFPDIVHAQDSSMVGTEFSLGSKKVKAAKVWSTLPAAGLLDRTCFFHHATYTNSHPNEPKVLRLMGGTAKQESLPSLYAQYLAGCLGTVQVEPLTLGGGANVTFAGRALPQIAPTSIASVLAKDAGPLGQMQTLREQGLDEINDVLRDGATAAQKNFIDAMVTSRKQVTSISDALLGNLASIKSNAADGQIAAAVTLIAMNIAPVIVISVPFGGDNHADAGLLNSEMPQHATGVDSIRQLIAGLQAAQLQDKVTFALLNVFGRTLKSEGTVGRTHWANHHAGIMIGKHVNPGVVGGLEAVDKDYNATSIDSKTGAAVAGGKGDITIDQSLESYAKTLGAALGVDAGWMSTNIAKGSVVASAIRS